MNGGEDRGRGGQVGSAVKEGTCGSPEEEAAEQAALQGDTGAGLKGRGHRATSPSRAAGLLVSLEIISSATPDVDTSRAPAIC